MAVVNHNLQEGDFQVVNRIFRNSATFVFLFVVAYLLSGCSSTKSETVDLQDTQSNDNLIGITQEATLVDILPTQTPTSIASLTRIEPGTPTRVILPTETMTATPTLAQSQYPTSTIYKILPEAYAWSKLMLLNGELQIDEGSQNTITSVQEPRSPANGQLHAFSYYSDQVAYWTRTNPSELWISDVALEEPRQIYTDREGLYVSRGSLPTENLQQVRWSPDDRHLITYASPGRRTHLIYHLETGQLEEWYWLCQDVVISPQTGRLAVLCTIDDRLNFSSENTYAIMEWEDSIWYTSERPERIISQSLPDGTIPWRFSADGTLLAYFDPNDSGHYLSIATVNGDIRRILPGSSPLQQDQSMNTFETQYYAAWPERYLGFFRWSSDGKMLLALMLGNVQHPCRTRQSVEGNDLRESLCWQVVDVTTGDVLWTDIDSEKTLFRDEFAKSTIRIIQAEFSPNGKMIAVHGQYFSNHLLAVVDLNTSIARRLFPLPVGQIHWASKADE